jgi:hypothetical protein
MRAVVLAMTLLLSTLAPSRAAPLCMSDAELLAFLQEVVLFGTGQGLGICARRFPSLAIDAQGYVHRFDETYGMEVRRVDATTLAIFERSFPGNGAATRDHHVLMVNASGRAQIEAFSVDQCRDFVSGVDAMLAQRSFEAATALVSAVRSAERTRVPYCDVSLARPAWRWPSAP